MNRLFNPDAPIMHLLSKIAMSIYLNALWMICCIPIVTIGASTTALFYVSQKLVKNEEGHPTQNFFHSFRANLKQATGIWLILLAVGLVLGVDAYALYHLRFSNAFWTVLTAVFIVALAAYVIVLLYIFPLLAHFDNTTGAMFRNSLIIGMHFLLCTVLMAAVYAAMVFLIIRIFTPAFLLGMGVCALLCSYLLSGILRQMEGSDPEGSSSSSNSSDGNTEDENR
ncbi:MAG: DUF624 domain-containing protein [Eubacteriales bacterium]|nr:DUF624 domain-containing protein [Eubacteriales bacterium]